MSFRDDWDMWRYQDPPRRWLFFVLLGLIAWTLPKIANGQSYPIPPVPYQAGGQTFYETNYSGSLPGVYPIQQDAERVLVQHAFSLVIMRPGVGQPNFLHFSTPEQANRPGDACPFPQVIDRHQGFRGYRGANGWIVIFNYVGAPSCKSIVVFRWDGIRYNKTGDVQIDSISPTRLDYGIFGNVAYVPVGTGGLWARLDLQTRTPLGSSSEFRDEARPVSWQVTGAGGQPPSWSLVPVGSPQPTPAPPTATPPNGPTPTTTPVLVASATPTTPPTTPTPCQPRPPFFTTSGQCTDGCQLLPVSACVPATSTPTMAPTPPASSTPVTTATPSKTRTAEPVPSTATPTNPPSPSPSNTRAPEATSTRTPTATLTPTAVDPNSPPCVTVTPSGRPTLPPGTPTPRPPSGGPSGCGGNGGTGLAALIALPVVALVARRKKSK